MQQRSRFPAPILVHHRRLHGQRADRHDREARANARRIVHAVNVYDDLVAALKLAKVYAEQAVPFVTPAKRDLALIVAALAKARAKT